MEIVEVLSFHLNNLEEVLEVSFRTNSDEEDFSRESEIPYLEISDFGYKFHESVDEEDNSSDDFDDFGDDDLFVDENEILTFLNEYYVLFPDKLPKSEML